MPKIFIYLCFLWCGGLSFVFVFAVDHSFFVLLFLAETPIMMEAISLQGKTANIIAKFKNPYRRKICTLIRIKIYKSCQHTTEQDLSCIPYA